MLNWFKTILISEDDNDPAFAGLVRNILIVIFVILVLLTITQTSIFTATIKLDAFVVLLGIAGLTGYFIYLANKMILWPGKVFLPTALLIALTFFTASENGLHDVTMIGYPAVIFIASLLLGRKSLLFWAIATSLCVGIVGYWDIAGFTPEPIARTTGIDTIVVGVLVIYANAGIAWLLLKRFEEIIRTARQNEREQIHANQELRELQISLETRITERTSELSQRSIELEAANQRNQQRANQFEAVAQVANVISSIRTLDELLPNIAHLVSEQFNFYHVGIFLNDASNLYATLSATNSEGGQRMLARGHQLKIGEQGIVGNVANSGIPRIALDVGKDAIFFNNPDLPDTHSEMAFPLMISGKIVGVLDLQSIESSAFDDEDLQVISILVNQVSLAIENARLFEESNKALAEAEALYRQYIRQAWGRMPKEQSLEGYHYSALGTMPIERIDKTSSNGNESPSKRPEIAVPIMLRGESIGMLAVQVPDAGQINNDQMDLIKAVADRVAISAENARLFEETTRRAERERLVTDITAKIRSTNDPESMIQITLNELKTALGATKVQLVPHTLQNLNSRTQTVAPPDAIPVGKSKRGKRKSGGIK